MQKIPSVFKRNYEGDRLIRDEVVAGAEWVLGGEGKATLKMDGCCCMVKGGRLFKRYEAKRGKVRPAGFEAAQEPDPVTGDVPGWLPVGDGPEDKWFKRAYESQTLSDGTYEAIGPHFQGNVEGLGGDQFYAHGSQELKDCPRDFAGMRDYLSSLDVEGVVFHHPDGRMAKVKKKDFGMKRKSTEAAK